MLWTLKVGRTCRPMCMGLVGGAFQRSVALGGESSAEPRHILPLVVLADAFWASSD